MVFGEKYCILTKRENEKGILKDIKSELSVQNENMNREDERSLRTYVDYEQKKRTRKLC